MLFLINNPLLLFIGLVVVGFILYITNIIVKEVKMNKLLDIKQASMRVKTKNPIFTRRIGFLTSTALAPVLVMALVLIIGSTQPDLPIGDQLQIQNSSDIKSLYSEFNEKVNSQYRTFNLFGGLLIDKALDDVDMMEPSEPSVADELEAGETGSNDYSKTNSQVIGVDEMDSVITDGKYIYVKQGNKVTIALAYTENLEEEALSNFKEIVYETEQTECPTQFFVDGMYADDDYLVVVGSDHESYCEDDYQTGIPDSDYLEYDYWWSFNNTNNVKVYVYDKNDDFSLQSEYSLSGRFIGTRKIGDNLFIITNARMPLQDDSVNVDNYLPHYVNGSTQVVVKYDDIVYVDGTNPNSFTSFFALDLDNEQVDMEVVLGDNASNIYVSPNNIYLIGNVYQFAALTEYIDVQNPVVETKTGIMKIEINDADVEYSSIGLVEGYTLNQFSMDEYNGYLRIVTTTVEHSFQTVNLANSWSSETINRIWVLNSDMEIASVVGAGDPNDETIETLGYPGETVQSSRCIGDYCYVVTFERTDPFYVVDMSNPEDPEIIGALKVPGFSSYLQPYGSDYMLGIGFGDNEGGTQGLKVSIYDISDKSSPNEFSTSTFSYDDYGWVNSSATYNHKNLLVSYSKKLIALPMSVSENGIYSSGIIVYSFNENTGLTYEGYVQHEENSDFNIYVYKSLFIDDYLYTISNKYIGVSSLDNPSHILFKIEIAEDNNYNEYNYN